MKKVYRKPEHINRNAPASFFGTANTAAPFFSVPSIQTKCAGEHEGQVQTRADGSPAQTAPHHLESSLNASKGSGSPLPPSASRQMESSMGTDFSDVRVHQDSNAAKMNKDLNAQAFTHGNDIYFNSGKFNPDTAEGKHLLAHELVHTVQQGEGAGVQKQIQRSFWGTVGGGIIGAGFGLGGLVVGAFLGDQATTTTRPLTAAEINEATKVFGNSLDYSRVRLTDSSYLISLGDTARTPFNTIYFPPGTLTQTDKGYFAWLIHELTHAWQTQHGVSVLTKIDNSMDESNYDFGGDAGLEQAAGEGKCFNDFNTEAQGDILENYYKISEGLLPGDLSIYEYYLFQVQYTGGSCKAPGPGIMNDILEPGYQAGADSGDRTA